MAFQAAASVPTVAATASELWPSMSTVLATPWRALRSRSDPPRQSVTQKAHASSAASHQHSARQVESTSGRRTHIAEPADCFNGVPTEALRLAPAPEAMTTAPSISSIFSLVPHHLLRRCSPVSLQPLVGLRHARQYSTFKTIGLRPELPSTPFQCLQKRTLFGGTISRNLLAHMEQTANNNPQSATAQNAFYSALLRANMPEIVVERYQTGRYATNPACEAQYLKALERVGQAEKAASVSGAQSSLGQSRNLSSDQLSAIGQAVAARSSGANVAVSRTGAGDKGSPLYVVVDESMGSTLFKWVKFFLYFGLFGYLAMVLITVVIETSGMLKRVGGQTHAEARPELQTTRFSDVQGCEEAKEELQELVEFLKAPDKFSTLGGKLPKGVLLTGPPGTGKTLLARAVAGEAGVPFFYMSGSEFDEVYVGVGAKRVRELFSAARAKAPSIVFIDELDAIGGKRNERDAAYAKQTLNQLLTDLDGFEQNSGVIFIAATNFPQLLDKALTRPGRFDRNIAVPLPDVRGRVAILKHHMRNIQIGTDVDAAMIARGTPGFSGAELENIVNQAAVHASKLKSTKVHMADFEWAKDKVMMGAERRSAVIQQKDKIMTAYHEGGHALVALLTKNTDPLYKATIMPRGHALGITYQLPEMDKVSMMKKEFMAQIDVCMGGKVAEELVYGPDAVTSGATSDISRATQIALHMVTQAGMSDALGNVDLQSNYNRLSSETKQRIEDEVRRIVEEGRERVTKLLTAKRKELDLLANALVEYETLNKEEIERIVRGEKLPDKLKAAIDVPIKVPDLIPPPISPPGVTSPGPSSGGEPSPVPGGQGEPPRPYPAGG